MRKFNIQEQNYLLETLRDKRDMYIKYRSRQNDDFAIGFFSEKINNITKLIREKKNIKYLNYCD